MENVFVLISKVPIDKLFSSALSNSTPSIISNLPFFKSFKFSKRHGFK